MIINNLTTSKTEVGHPDSNIAYITVSYQPIMQVPGVLDVNSDSMLYTIGLIFKPNTKMYDFIEISENPTGSKVTIKLATKNNTSLNSVAHIFTFGEKPYSISFSGIGQEFEIEDIVLNGELLEPTEYSQVESIASSKKKPKSVSVYTGPAIISQSNLNEKGKATKMKGNITKIHLQKVSTVKIMNKASKSVSVKKSK